jgi:Flp pilus assembly protein CpaB
MFFVLIVAIGCGLGASLLVARYVQGTQQEVKKVKVWWVKKDKSIIAFSPLNKDSLEARDMEEKEAEAGGFVTGDDGLDALIKDKKMVKTSLGSGKPLMLGDIYNSLTDSLRGVLRVGEIAKTIRVDPISSVAGFVQPGHRVDIEATTQMTTVDGAKPYTQIILQNVEVLATNEMTSPSPDQPSKPADRVTLRLTRDDALLLGSYQEGSTSLRLLLRPVNDKQIYVTTGRLPFGRSLEQNTANVDDLGNLAMAGPSGGGITPPPFVPPPADEKTPPEDANKNAKEETAKEPAKEPPPVAPSVTARQKNIHIMKIIDDPNKPVRVQKFELEDDKGDNKALRVTQ